MDYILQITAALNKDVENIAFLSYFPEGKLDKKLLSIRQQIEVAKKNKLTDALELLKIWEQQVIEAKSLKQELQVKDNPALDLNFYLPELEVYDMLEKRQELLKQRLNKDSTAEAERKTNKSL
jgi:hypothetical protein